MKCQLSIFFLILFAFSASTQNIEVGLSVKIGMSKLQQPSFSNRYTEINQVGNSGDIGMFLKYKMNKYLAVNTGVYLSQYNGLVGQQHEWNGGVVAINDYPSFLFSEYVDFEETSEYTLNYLTLPFSLNIQYKFLSIYGGLQFNFHRYSFYQYEKYTHNYAVYTGLPPIPSGGIFPLAPTDEDIEYVEDAIIRKKMAIGFIGGVAFRLNREIELDFRLFHLPDNVQTLSFEKKFRLTQITLGINYFLIKQ